MPLGMARPKIRHALPTSKPTARLEPTTKYAVAKINLGLHVLRRRTDEYHDIETVFLPIGWTDRLTFQSANVIRMTCTDADLPTDESNLCIKAARALATATLGDDPAPGRASGRGVHIHLEKHIPYGSGLGGGSSDAAVTLQGCAACWELDQPGSGDQPGSAFDLEPVAASLGADVAFFLHGKPSFATGIGEKIEPLDLSQTAFKADFKVLVVVPDVHVSTAEAYANVTPNEKDRPDLRQAIRQPVETWKDTIVNDFEASVSEQFPVIGDIRESLYASGALYAAMSGSGSAVFGLFAAHPEVAWSRIRKDHPTSRTWMGSLNA